MNRQTVIRVVAGLVLVAVLVAAGFALFNAGAAYSVAQSPEWARLMEQRMETGGAGVMPGGHLGMRGMMGFGPHMGGWGMSWGFGIFGIFGLIIKLILFLIVLRVIFGVFFGWRRGGWGWHGGPGGWEQRGREKFEEWHKQAHGGTEPPQAQTPSQ